MLKTKVKKIIKNNLSPILVSVFCFFLFFDGFLTYFHQDDFIQMFYSQNLKSVLDAFNIFRSAEFAFYRPIPTQLYFFITKSIFGWNPLGYHVVNFLIFAVNIFLFYHLVKTLVNKKIASFAVIFFAVNTTHFAPLHAASYVHELFLVLFSLLSCLSFAKYLKSAVRFNLFLAVLFFIGALMSKETAVVVPGLLAIEYLLFSPKKSMISFFKIILLFLIFLISYLSFHFFLYGMPESSSYRLVIGKENLKMYLWYFIWGLSAPNILIDFIEPGLKIKNVFFDITKINGYVFFMGFFALMIFLGILFTINLLKKRDNNKVLIFSFLWFFLSLIPLVVFPLHKLAIEQALAILGLSLFVGFVISKFSNKVAFCFICLYVLIAINSAVIERRTHWIIRSSIQAKNIVNLIKNAKIGSKKQIYFKDGAVVIPEYGSSKQIFLASGNGKLFSLMFGIIERHVHFESVNPLPLNYTGEILKVDSSKLLGY